MGREITWRNVGSTADTGGVMTAYNTLNNAVSRFGTTIGDYFSKTLVDRQNRIDDKITDTNTAYALDVLNSANNREQMNSITNSGVTDLSYLDRITGGKINLKEYGKAKANWANDVNNRFIANDNLRMSDPEYTEAYAQALSAYAKGDTATFNKLNQKYQFSMQIEKELAGLGRNDLEFQYRKQRDAVSDKHWAASHALQMNNQELALFREFRAMDKERVELKSKANADIEAYNQQLKIFGQGDTSPQAISAFNEAYPDLYTKKLQAEQLSTQLDTAYEGQLKALNSISPNVIKALSIKNAEGSRGQGSNIEAISATINNALNTQGNPIKVTSQDGKEHTISIPSMKFEMPKFEYKFGNSNTNVEQPEVATKTASNEPTKVEKAKAEIGSALQNLASPLKKYESNIGLKYNAEEDKVNADTAKIFDKNQESAITKEALGNAYQYGKQHSLSNGLNEANSSEALEVYDALAEGDYKKAEKLSKQSYIASQMFKANKDKTPEELKRNRVKLQQTYQTEDRALQDRIKSQNRSYSDDRGITQIDWQDLDTRANNNLKIAKDSKDKKDTSTGNIYLNVKGEPVSKDKYERLVSLLESEGNSREVAKLLFGVDNGLLDNKELGDLVKDIYHQDPDNFNSAIPVELYKNMLERAKENGDDVSDYTLTGILSPDWRGFGGLFESHLNTLKGTLSDLQAYKSLGRDGRKQVKLDRENNQRVRETIQSKVRTANALITGNLEGSNPSDPTSPLYSGVKAILGRDKATASRLGNVLAKPEVKEVTQKMDKLWNNYIDLAKRTIAYSNSRSVQSPVPKIDDTIVIPKELANVIKTSPNLAEIVEIREKLKKLHNAGITIKYGE